MSKMLNALDKLRELRREESGAMGVVTETVSQVDEKNPVGTRNSLSSEETPEGQISFLGKINLNSSIFIVLLVAIGISSIIISFKTLSELQRSRQISLSLAKEINSQDQKINQLSQLISSAKSEGMRNNNSLEEQFKGLNTTLKSREKEIAEMTTDYNVLHLMAKDLTESNQELTEKYIEMGQKIDVIGQEIKEFKTLELIINGK